MRLRTSTLAAPVWLLLFLSLALIPPAVSQTNSTVSLDIPAQPLDQAITELASQTGLTIRGDVELLRGRQASALQGDYTPEAALRSLLVGTGVTYRFTGANMVTLEQAAAQGEGGPMQLGPIMIGGAAESAFGPVEGYVATRSATGTKTDTPSGITFSRSNPIPCQ